MDQPETPPCDGCPRYLGTEKVIFATARGSYRGNLCQDCYLRLRFPLGGRAFAARITEKLRSAGDRLVEQTQPTTTIRTFSAGKPPPHDSKE